MAIFTKFCLQAFRYKDMKIYFYDDIHLTKMAAMPIYGKNTFKILFPETSEPISDLQLRLLYGKCDSGKFLLNKQPVILKLVHIVN